MEINLQKPQKLDFGLLIIQEKKSITPQKLPFLHLQCSGYFDGFQEGPDGKIFDYFEHILPKKSLRIVVNLRQVRMYSDMAPVLVRSLHKRFYQKQGGVIVAEPSPLIRKIMSLIQMPFVQTLDEAMAQFDGKCLPPP